MYIKDLVKITGGKFSNLPHLNRKINKFKLDSRKIKRGDIFICIGKGINYIEEAIENGAIGIISEEEIKLKCHVGILKVDSIKDAILKLGSYVRCKYGYIPLIAITGSVGKSTTKELIYNILSSKYNVLKSEGNKNNYIGVAETLFNLDKTYDIVVLEMGMNHLHEIEDLSFMARPNIGIITCIGTAHIGNLGSKKNIFKAKMEILNGMDNGYLIVPPNDFYLTKLHMDNVLKCYDIDVKYIKVNDKLRFELRYENKEYNVKFNIPNKYYIDNILLAFKAATLFDIEPNTIITKINEYEPLEKRMNIINKDKYTLIDDTYNSSYESLKGSLEYIRKIPKKKIIILGDIKELGIYTKKIHKKINLLLNKIRNKEVLLVGEAVRVIDGIHFNNNSELMTYLKDIDLDNTIILLKGSRLMRLEEVKDYILANF